MCSNYGHFHTLILEASCKYKYEGLYPPSYEHISQNPVMLSFAKRPQREQVRMLLAGNP